MHMYSHVFFLTWQKLAVILQILLKLLFWNDEKTKMCTYKTGIKKSCMVGIRVYSLGDNTFLHIKKRGGGGIF